MITNRCLRVGLIKMINLSSDRKSFETIASETAYIFKSSQLSIDPRDAIEKKYVDGERITRKTSLLVFKFFQRTIEFWVLEDWLETTALPPTTRRAYYRGTNRIMYLEPLVGSKIMEIQFNEDYVLEDDQLGYFIRPYSGLWYTDVVRNSNEVRDIITPIIMKKIATLTGLEEIDSTTGDSESNN